MTTPTDDFHSQKVEQLLNVWQCASDFLLAEKNEGFAIENGGVVHLKELLTKAVAAYEE